jgi:exodeoxyribonuclease V beta subunit
VERVDGGGGREWAPTATAPVSLSASSFDRSLDPRWRRTSYSALTLGAHEAKVATEAEEPVVSDEVMASGDGADRPRAGDDGAPDPLRDVLRDVSLPLAAMRGGPAVGTVVHRVLETIDFAAPDLSAALAGALSAGGNRYVDLGDSDAVLSGLGSAVRTPLGPLVENLRLRDIGRGDRVDELSFELPLVGGDAPSATLEVPSIGRLLAQHLGPDDPLRGYAERLDDPLLEREVRGYLSGSLDLVFRTPDGRYTVVDYKTNWLAPDGEDITAWHYRPDALLDEMYRFHYPLQALLYVVALHRYLRWRVPGYTAGRHLAGVLYLFLRGMTGADVATVDGAPCGVFAWKPPSALVEAMSDVLDTGRVAS